jgi:hypothetical protein
MSVWEAAKGGEHSEGGSSPWETSLQVGAAGHTAFEFKHALDLAQHAGGEALHHAHGPGGLQLLSPFALVGGVEHMLHAAHDRPARVDGAAGQAYQVADVGAGAAEAASGAVGTAELVGSGLSALGEVTGSSALGGLGTGLGSLGATLGPLAGVLGAFAGGWSIGRFLDDQFHLSDTLSGPTPAERAGYVNASERGATGIADSNQRYFNQSLERLKDTDGDRGPAMEMLARHQLSEDVADPRLMAAAKATLAMRHAAEEQAALGEKIRNLSGMKKMGGPLGGLAQAELARLSAPYAS